MIQTRSVLRKPVFRGQSRAGYLMIGLESAITALRARIGGAGDVGEVHLHAMNSHVDRIKPDSFGITTYLESLRRSKYQIPTFQREVVWERDRVKRLWDSICKFYPLGSILVWRTTTQLHNHREIGGHQLCDQPAGQDFLYLLDGQQRTTALLTSMYGGSIKGQDVRDHHLFVDLTIEGASEVEDEAWRERFLFLDEITDQGGKLHRNTGRQKRHDAGLIVKLEDIAHRYADVERKLVNKGRSDYDNPARQELRRFKSVFDNYKLSFIELRGIEVAEVCQIFERINQAGQPLSMFDIVVAKTFVPKTKGNSGFYLRGLFDDFRCEIETAGSGYRVIDNTTLLQILAILVRDSVPESGIYNITDRYLNLLRTEHLEQVWVDGKEAIKRVFDFLDNHLRLKGPALIPYRYFYMSMASYFFNNKSPNYDFLQRYFWYFSFHNEDLLSNTTHLRDHIRRLREARDGGDFGFERFLIDRDRLRNTTYSSRGRLSRAMLALFANQDPRDWEVPARSVLSSVYYTLTDHPNLHHVFPLDFCEKHFANGCHYADSLLNIAYLTQITNLHISNKNPLVYLRDYVGPRFGDIERTHLLPDLLVNWVKSETMPEDALEEFVEARLKLVVQSLQKYLRGIAFEVVDTRSAEISIPAES